MVKKSGLVGLAVLALPLLELIALLVIGNALGFWLTLFSFLGLSFFGMTLLRYRAARMASVTLGSIRNAAVDRSGAAGLQRSIPGNMLGLFGAGLVVLPGYVTGAIGLLLQLPPVRHALAPHIGSQVGSFVGTVGSKFPGRGEVIDVDLHGTDSVADSATSHSPKSPGSQELNY